MSLALNAGIYNVLFGMRAGAALVIMDSFQPEEFAELVRRFEIRSTVLPPGAMAMLVDPSTLPPVQAPVCNSSETFSPIPRPGKSSALAVLNSYGQAEIGEVIGWTATGAKEHPEKVGAIGRPHWGST